MRPNRPGNVFCVAAESKSSFPDAPIGASEGASETSEHGIHKHNRELWIPGLRILRCAIAHRGMTKIGLLRCDLAGLLSQVPIGPARRGPVSDGIDIDGNGMTPSVTSVTRAGSSHHRILNGALTGWLRRFAPRNAEEKQNYFSRNRAVLVWR
jgi:hypothetical protein